MSENNEYEYEIIDDEFNIQLNKKRKRKSRIILILSCLLCIVVSFVAGAFVTRINTPLNSVATKESVYEQVLDVMANQWFFASESENIKQELIDKSLYGMTKSETDIHTTYMSKQEMERFYESIESNFVGIGVKVRNNGTYLVINTVYRNSPADISGLKKGDMIVAVDGVDIAGMEMDAIVDMIKGEENTKVVISVIRDDMPMDVDVIRQQVNTTVEGEVLENNVGYVLLSSFGDLSKDQLETYLMDFESQGVNKLLLDLRDNGGGHLNSVIDIGGLFLPKGTVVVQDEHPDGSLIEYKCQENEQFTYDKIVIIVNEYTASAAEVLTLALKEELDNVTVVGTNTYGKGTIQTTMPLKDGSALKVTTGKWNSPNGTNIDKVGIEPDVVVNLPSIITEPLYALKEGESFTYDQVGALVVQLQHALGYLGYPVDREDGYFDQETYEALKAFEQDNGLAVDGVFTEEDNIKLLYEVGNKWSEPGADVQKNEALRIINE